jgi:hypothetical protein
MVLWRQRGTGALLLRTSPAAGIEQRIGELINAHRAAVASRRSIASAAYFGACGFPL